jgi:hypothetical protein
MGLYLSRVVLLLHLAEQIEFCIIKTIADIFVKMKLGSGSEGLLEMI